MGTRKKIPYFSGNGNPKEHFIFQERYIQNPSITDFSYILGNGTGCLYYCCFFIFLYSGKQKPRKVNPYISGNRNPKKLLIFWEKELLRPSSKKKKNTPKKIPYISGIKEIILFQEMELSSSMIQKFLIFQEATF